MQQLAQLRVRVAITLGIALGGVPASAQQVLLVDADGGPGADFTDLQPALDAAAEGQVVLILPGSYSQFVVDGKSLSIFAAAPGVAVEGRCRVRNVGPGQRVVLDGLKFHSIEGTALQVDDCPGSVWFEGLVVESIGNPFVAPSVGVQVSDADNLVMVDCAVRSTVGEQITTNGSNAGLQVLYSNVYLFDCVATAGLQNFGYDGDPGVEAGSSFVFASGCRMVGGRGSDGKVFGGAACADGSDGGPGLRSINAFQGPGSEVLLLGSVSIGGEPGRPSSPACSPGAQGPSLEEFPGSSIQDLGLQLPPRRLELSGPISSGQSLHGTLSGSPAELGWIVASIETSAVFVPALHGVLATTSSGLAIQLGPLSPAGELDFQFQVTLPGGTPSATVFAQGLLLSAADGLVLSGPRATLVVGP
ncbi:hypothetical protein [Engelhardtia mirabilis]|uniref:Right handed beta helix domain-containing protein n=1 Tax=Engelhardtia mirabilis TaxID=2528011 RepID=A0A518BFE6_9BACT|nr:hypothetical protein Pla133_07690 [Planctomycetes bacterium Pla133]QDV00030.1 hypothetical protein Pla86_07680 [Planctomycetes bacterium Pla86]